jgi:type II secretory ATPase GspE/PulE/Tfp pilus assembly ATPase PilB-like protein
MRQDPEVIMVGEIRDRATAEAALQASLTGHLMLSTFHAGSAAETVSRLLDMGIEPYVLRSGLLAILNQRLFRRLCPCAEPTDDPDARLGLAVERAMGPRGASRVRLAEVAVCRRVCRRGLGGPGALAGCSASNQLCPATTPVGPLSR